MRVPCHNCPDRAEGCHATCERYKEYEREREQIRDARQEFNKRVSWDIESLRRRKGRP